jgi:hypothetical protein
MNCAGATNSRATVILGASQVERFADDPEEGGGHRIPRYFYTSDPQSWIPAQGRGDWCSDTDSALW